MLHVCGITYDHTINYGSSLQAYALLRTVESMRLADGTDCSYQIIPIRTFPEWNANPSFTTLLLTPLLNLYRAQFQKFDDQYLRFAPLASLKELPSLNRTVDAFMCGSDVVWNPDLNKQFNAFYLDFATNYKFSYAASFGKTEIDQGILDKIKKPIAELNAISVRENAALSIVKQCTDKPAQVVVDPVLLLSEKEWMDVLSTEQRKDKYIFVYITHLSDPIKRFLKTLKEKTGLQIVYSAYGPKQAINLGVLQVQTPQKWLRLLHDAEYVVTNSFHATAFSVLFHRKFFTVVNGDPAKGINVRMNDFLNTIGLHDRMISGMPEKMDLSEIEFTDVDSKIRSMRAESLEFLRKNLEAAHQEQKKKQEKAHQ